MEATNWYAPASLLTGGHGFALVTRNSTPAAWSRMAELPARDRLDAAVADLLEKKLAGSSAGLISNTDEHGRRIVDLYKIDAQIPHRTIGLSLPPELLQKAQSAPQPGWRRTRQNLFVGRAEQRKGFAELIGAIELLAAEVAAGTLSPFHVDLLGVPSVDLPSHMSARARRHVSALGRQPDEMLHELYQQSHIVAAPSRYESFGLVYQEAIAFGRPVVASSEDPSAREVVGATGAGLLAERTHPEEIATPQRSLIESPDLRAQLHQRAVLAAGRFDRPYLGRETVELYREATARVRKARL